METCQYSVQCLFYILYNSPRHVDGSVVKLKGLFGVCYFDLLPSSMSLKDVPVQYAICFRPEGAPPHPGKGEQIKYIALPISHCCRMFPSGSACL